MKQITVLLVTLLVSLCPVYGAEEDAAAASADSNETTPDQPQEENAESPDLQADDGLTRPEDENFVPSVRITEDLPVAFPVDI